MSERTAPKDNQIDVDLESRKMQAARFLDVVKRTAKASGKREDYNGSRVSRIKLGDMNVRFEADNKRRGENHIPDRLIIDSPYEEHEDAGNISIYRVNTDGLIVRDISVWDDTETLGGMHFKDLEYVFPHLKDREVSQADAEVLLSFVGNPLIGKDLARKLLKVKDPSDKKEIDKERKRLRVQSEERRVQNEKNYWDWMSSNPGFISYPDPRDQGIG